MEYELITKEVNFNGDYLLAAQDNNSNKIYVGVKWVCNGIGVIFNSKKNIIAQVKINLMIIYNLIIKGIIVLL